LEQSKTVLIFSAQRLFANAYTPMISCAGDFVGRSTWNREDLSG